MALIYGIPNEGWLGGAVVLMSNDAADVDCAFMDNNANCAPDAKKFKEAGCEEV